MDGERDSIKYKKAAFMTSHIGKEFDGIISGMFDMGVFVQIIEIHCEGLVPFDRFEESYTIAEIRLEANSNQTGTTLKIGDRLRGTIVDVDVDRVEIDMDLVVQ